MTGSPVPAPSLRPTAEELAAARVGIIPRGTTTDYKNSIFYVGVYCVTCRRRWREPQVAAGFVNFRWWRCPKGCNWVKVKPETGIPESW